MFCITLVSVSFCPPVCGKNKLTFAETLEQKEIKTSYVGMHTFSDKTLSNDTLVNNLDHNLSTENFGLG